MSGIIFKLASLDSAAKYTVRFVLQRVDWKSWHSVEFSIEEKKIYTNNLFNSPVKRKLQLLWTYFDISCVERWFTDFLSRVQRKISYLLADKRHCYPKYVETCDIGLKGRWCYVCVLVCSSRWCVVVSVALCRLQAWRLRPTCCRTVRTRTTRCSACVVVSVALCVVVSVALCVVVSMALCVLQAWRLRPTCCRTVRTRTTRCSACMW